MNDGSIGQIISSVRCQSVRSVVTQKCCIYKQLPLPVKKTRLFRVILLIEVHFFCKVASTVLHVPEEGDKISVVSVVQIDPPTKPPATKKICNIHRYRI